MTRRDSASALAPLLAVAGLGAATALLAGPESGIAALAAGALAMASYRLGRRHGAAEGRMVRFRVADELVQYRAFTRLMRDQGVRVIDQSTEAVTALAIGLTEIDHRATALLERLEPTPTGGIDPAALRAAIEEISELAVPLFGQLQFQDVTRQQLTFLARLSRLVDEHIAEMTRLLGDRRALDRTTRFQELFDQALDDTVMSSQRDDYRAATGIEQAEATGPRVELF
ncbi:MAG: hypothetical protein RLZZ501_2391 [Pseudomonadota bacterium]|jgi:hypothetical protein